MAQPIKLAVAHIRGTRACTALLDGTGVSHYLFQLDKHHHCMISYISATVHACIASTD